MINTLKNLEQYTPEWDVIMNAELEIVEDAYNYKNGVEKRYLSPKYSIKIPNNCYWI